METKEYNSLFIKVINRIDRIYSSFSKTFPDFP
jgi:hypothetical protein